MPFQQSTIKLFTAPQKKTSPFRADKASVADSAKVITSRESAIATRRDRARACTPPASQSSTAPFSPPTLAMESSFELPDSTDWIETSLPSFEPVEAALRCEVCKEFYENPVITPCSHTFCSLCIRRCITSDGKCPACKTSCSSDKLLPNHAVREVVNRFQEARPKALELARRDKEQDEADVDTKLSGTKRKLEDTDLEEESPRRNTRSRTKRNSQRDDGLTEMPIEVKDSEDEDDEEFVPEGFARCPMCNRPKKVEDMWQHTANCNGEPEPTGGRSGGRSTRLRNTKPQYNALSDRRKPPAPAMERLPGINYALLTEAKLRKKLQELGINASGKKDLMIRRHTEWLHLWNSNCDASDDRRKTKSELKRELDTWERTQGGLANASVAPVMKKDFDGKGHASTHKSQFEDLIANARRKRATPSEERSDATPQPMSDTDRVQSSDAPEQTSTTDTQTSSHVVNAAKPYEGNETALATVRAKVEQANLNGSTLPSLNHEASSLSNLSAHAVHASQEKEPGIQDPFGSPSRKVSMFALPQDPVVDVENSTAAQ